MIRTVAYKPLFIPQCIKKLTKITIMEHLVWDYAFAIDMDKE